MVKGIPVQEKRGDPQTKCAVLALKRKGRWQWESTWDRGKNQESVVSRKPKEESGSRGREGGSPASVPTVGPVRWSQSGPLGFPRWKPLRPCKNGSLGRWGRESDRREFRRLEGDERDTVSADNSREALC